MTGARLGDLPAPGDTPRPFLLLTRVLSWDAACLVATCPPLPAGEDSGWRLMEAAAQAATLHQRALRDCSDHAFLLGFDHVPLPLVLPAGRPLRVTATALGQSQRAASYAARLEALDDGGAPLPGALTLGLVIGHAPYDGTFRREDLEEHYRRRLTWLVSGQR